MEENRFQLIDPRQQEINKTTSNLYVPAMKEMGWEPPLYVLLYNQVRYYEDFGKLKIGYSVASKETLAEQFGVTPSQIEKAFDNLTNKYHLGNWIVSDSKIFRNVKRVWVSNIRQQRGSLEDTIKILENSSKIGALLLQQRSKTPTAEEFASLDDPCPKVSESKLNIYTSKSIQSEQAPPSFPIDVREGGPAKAGGTVGSIDKVNKQVIIDEFERLWKEYPRKQGKVAAFKAYAKARKENDCEVLNEHTVLEGIKKYKEHIKKSGTEPRYIKQGSTWFNQHCWEDEYEISKERELGW